MTIVTGYRNSPSTDELKALAVGTFSVKTATQFQLKDVDYTVTADGSGFSYNGNGSPKSGTITGITLQYGITTTTWTGMSVSAASLWSFVASGDPAGFGNLVFGGNDAFNGADWTAGFAGYGGDDVFNYGLSFGPTPVDGGPGYDTIVFDADHGSSNEIALDWSLITNVEKVSLIGSHNYSVRAMPSYWPGNHPSQFTIDGSASGTLVASLSGDDKTAFTVSGGAGADKIYGGALSDTLSGGAGADQLVGNAGNDVIHGEAGDDLLVGCGGDDVLDGGDGNDTVWYTMGSLGTIYADWTATSGVTVNLSLSGAQSVGGGAGTDTLTSIENIVGTAFNDVLTGNAGDNVITGGTGKNTLDGGGGTDTAKYSAARSVYTILQNADGSYTVSNYDTTDTLTNFEFLQFSDQTVSLSNTPPSNAITGTSGPDTLNGTDGADVISGGGGDDVINGGAGNDNIDGGDGNDTLNGGTGTNYLNGGPGVDTAVYAGNFSTYSFNHSSSDKYTIAGLTGPDTLVNVEYAKFDDRTVRLLLGNGVGVNWSADPSQYMSAIRDFDGNDLGGSASWKLIGTADVNGDGRAEHILFNRLIGRWAEVGAQPDGLVYFSNYGWAGDTRVVGIYIDPLVANGTVVKNSDFDSQRRFQNDLMIDNIKSILGDADYNHDGLREVYFSLTDGTAYLHAYMHADGNIQYANYQNKQQVIDYLTTNGFGSSTWSNWFPASQTVMESVPANLGDTLGASAWNAATGS